MSRRTYTFTFRNSSGTMEFTITRRTWYQRLALRLALFFLRLAGEP